MSVVQAYYYTDPACPWSWAQEPAWRRLAGELGGNLRVQYVMAGMAREFGDPDAMARSAIEAGLDSGMPVDPRVWWEAAPHSSYPACIAVKAAAEQGLEAPYLRRLREGLLCRRRKLDLPAALLEEARAIPGMNVERFGIDLSSHALLEAFAADLERGRSVDAEHHSEGAGRVKLPSVEFVGADGDLHGVYGPSPYEELAAAAAAAGASAAGTGAAPSVEEALRSWGSLATAEVAEICRLTGPRAPAELWRAATEWRVQAEPAGTGELWRVP